MTRGGKREGAGRPRDPRTRKHAVTAMLDDAELAVLEASYDHVTGSRSEAAREAMLRGLGAQEETMHNVTTRIGSNGAGNNVLDCACTCGASEQHSIPSKGEARINAIGEHEIAFRRAHAGEITDPAMYIAVAGRDVGTCEALRWAAGPIEPFVLARGEDAEAVEEAAIAAAGHEDVVLYDVIKRERVGLHEEA